MHSKIVAPARSTITTAAITAAANAVAAGNVAARSRSLPPSLEVRHRRILLWRGVGKGERGERGGSARWTKRDNMSAWARTAMSHEII